MRPSAASSSYAHAVQAPILCEMSAFVASCCDEGEEVSKAYCNLLDQWATDLHRDLELVSLCTNQNTSVKQRQEELKLKLKMCHYLVVIACGCSAAPGKTELRDLEPYADLLCKHMLLVCFRLRPHRSSSFRNVWEPRIELRTTEPICCVQA